MRSLHLILISLLLSACDTPADIDVNSPSSDYPDTTYEYVNQLRKSAGMISLETQNSLANAALNHSTYLRNNQIFGHAEIQGFSYFTGEYSPDRAIYAGYNSRTVAEGISNGNSNFLALDNLFSAIYHRFTLLNYSLNEIGFGYISGEKNVSSPILTHNMGNSALNLLCQTPYSGSDSSISSTCKDNVKVSVELYNEKILATQTMNPDLVVWPGEDATDIPPVFFDEIPDPLSDYSVSGYPISVQFNPGLTTDIILNDFTLSLAGSNEIFTNTRLLTETTDPNNSFSSMQFALFPLERLDWNTSYEAEISYTLNGISQSKKWQFTTRIPAGKLQKIGINETEIKITSSSQATLYFVPSGPNDIIKTASTQHTKNVDLKIKYLDRNTFFIVASGRPGEIITLILNARTIKITLI